MPVFSFSTQEKKPSDAEVVRRIKKHCYYRNLNFSALVVELLKQYEREVLVDERSKKA
jgi:hypothetical protein